MLDLGAGVKACDEFVVIAAKPCAGFTGTDPSAPIFLTK
jgi:hypothetical protein